MKKLNYTSNFELTAVPPFSFELTVHKPAGWHWLTPFERFDNGVLRTAIELSSQKSVGLRLRSIGSIDQPRILATMFSGKKLTNEEEKEVLDTVTRCAELKADISEFYSIAEHDPILAQVKGDLYGMRCGSPQRLFHDLVLAITLQNAPLKRSEQMLDLLFRTYGQRVMFDGRTIIVWFTPEQIAKTSVRELREKCKLGFRAKYLRAVAESIQSGECPTLEELDETPFKRAKAELMKLKGIGEYSAEIVLRRLEGFPVDVWSAKIFWKLFFPEEIIPSIQIAIQKVRKHAEERWGKWRGYAFVYVLNDLDNLSRKFGLQEY